MASVEFGGALYATERKAMEAACQEWLTAGGAWDSETIAEILSVQTSKELATDMLAEWDIEYLGYSEADIEAEFESYRFREDLES